MNWKRTTPRLLVVVVALVTVTGMLAAPGVVAASGADGPPQPPQRYYGTVENAEGNAVGGLLVEVTQGGEVVASDVTDGDGYYDLQVAVDDVDTDATVTISAAGENVERDVSSGGSAQVDLAVDVESSGGGSDEVAEDGSATVDLGDGEGVRSAAFEFPSGTTGSVGVMVSSSPTGDAAADPIDDGTVVSYFEITPPDGYEGGDTTVRFTVLTDRLDDLGLSADTVQVVHYDGGSWNYLDTSVVGETSSTVTLEATASGFSPFALAAQEGSDTPTDTPGDGGGGDGDTPTETEAPSGGGGGNPGGNTGGQTGGSDDTPTAAGTDEPSTPTDTASTPTDEPSTPTDEAATGTDEPATTTDEPGTDSGPATLIVAGGALALLVVVGGLYVAYRRD